jgi:7-cyano-7-deazaguanine synthase in queuosine biosynthesis
LRGSGSPLALNLWGGEDVKNINFDFGDVHSKVLSSFSPRFVDLAEIAAYIYCADQAISRVKMDVDRFGADWRRSFRIFVPVREPGFWKSQEVKTALCETLNFLSDEFFEFTFFKAQNPPLIQGYLTYKEITAPIQEVEQVMLYSGGLDSLAGAVEEIINKKRRVVLVSHRSTPKLEGAHQRLEALLAAKAGALRPVHLKVKVSKKLTVDEEDHTQRTRSFLFGSLGAAVAVGLGLKNVRFYENGVLSLNLPMTAQLVGSRATRTTHPRVIHGFQKLFSLVAGEALVVENPFIGETKGEVIQKIVKAGCGPMIEASTSCPHTRQSTKEQTHCGVCSQCIDRRFGIIAAGADGFDPDGHYRMNVFTESRGKDADKLLVGAYLERSNQIEKLKNIADFIDKYSESARSFRYLDGPAAGAAERVFDLYRRHAAEVNGVVEKMTTKHLTLLRQRTLPGDCLLRLVYDPQSATLVPATPLAASVPMAAGAEQLLAHGKLRYRMGFEDIWFEDTYYDLRGRIKAQLCIQFLVEQKAFDAKSARHLVDEIDPFVRERGDFLRAANIKIDHYFNDREGKLPGLRKALIATAGRNGRYFLKVE